LVYIGEMNGKIQNNLISNSCKKELALAPWAREQHTGLILHAVQSPKEPRAYIAWLLG